MRVQIKKLHPDAVIPKYQTKGASGFDLHALEDVEISYGETKLVKTGLAVAVQEGFELQVRPRSGLSLKTGLRVANAPGTVDSDYRGECCVVMHHTFNNLQYGKPILIKKGDRIAQGVICPVVQAELEVVSELDETVRGAGGFGSTGSN
jgi:dUTP pyrophosphatase